MYKSLSIQMVTALAEQTRLKEEDGLLLAVHPDFILAVRPGMDEDKRNAVADALLTTAESLSLPVMETPAEGGDSGAEDTLRVPPNILRTAGFLGLNYRKDLTYTVENGRIIIEMEDY